MQTVPIVKDELIGKTITIIECTDPTWSKISGVIVDETQQTLVIESQGKQRRIAKRTATFMFDQDPSTTVHGSRLQYRPEDRIKKAR